MTDTSKEAMKLALEALTATMATHGFQKYIDQTKDDAIIALREALAEQPAPVQQEPVDIWVLTSEHNAYDQYGEYFEAVFIGKPTENQIRNACALHGEYDKEEVEHILSGGGRIKHEDKWYNLQKEEAAHGIKENT